MFRQYVCLLLLFFTLLPVAAHAQATNQENQPVGSQASGTIKLDLPDPMPLATLLDFASQRLGFNIIYDPQKLEGLDVTIKSPADIPAGALRELIDAALGSKGFVLAEDDRAGLLRLVTASELAMASEIQEGGAAATTGGAVITQVFLLSRVDPEELRKTVEPFLTPDSSQVSVNKSLSVLIVTDFAVNVRRVESLIQRLENAAGDLVYRYYTVNHLAARDLFVMLMQALGAGSVTESMAGADVVLDEPANRVLLIGSAAEVEAAVSVAKSLDEDPGMQTQVYRFRHTTAQRFETQIRGMLEASASSLSFETSVDRQAGLLILTAPNLVHARVEALRKQLDVPGDAAASPIRFYALQNANAADVLETIRGLEEGGSAAQKIQIEGAGSSSLTQSVVANPSAVDSVVKPFDPGASGSQDAKSPAPGAVHAPNATLTADENTNSIIVVADPSTQAVYAGLIEELDRRRAQVMIEVTLVVMDTTDNFSFGVDILAGDREGTNQSFIFNSFGLSQLTRPGQLSVIPGLGFNGVVLDADIADIVVQALQADGNTRVVSAPRILINDNETGKIASVSGQPVASLNQGQITDSTTFQGFVEAGTSIEMTPHIAEGDFLRLEFKVALESFNGDAASTNLPPPKQSNTVESHVTLPDGGTIVVGGINLTNASEQIRRIPILGEIPVLEYLFSSREIIETQSTLFVFLRPVILRQDNFDDLRFYSRADVRDQGLGPAEGLDAHGYPVSEPRWVR